VNGHAVGYTDLLLAHIREEQHRGAHLPKRATKGPEPGSRGPGESRKMDRAYAMALKTAPRLGMAAAIAQALHNCEVMWRNPEDYTGQVLDLGLRIAAELNLPPLPPRRASYRPPRVRPTDRQAPHELMRQMALALARATGQGAVVDGFDRLMRGQSPA
jgi:hypothetical protein